MQLPGPRLERGGLGSVVVDNGLVKYPRLRFLILYYKWEHFGLFVYNMPIGWISQ